MTLKFDGWPRKTIGHLLYAISNFVHRFKIIRWIQTGVRVRKRPIWDKIGDFLSPVWPWNSPDDLEKQWGASSMIRQALPTTVHHFIAISEFTLELQSGNAQIGKNSAFLSCVTLEFESWPWKTIGHLFYDTSSFVHNLGQNRRFFVLCNLEIWQMTLKNNRHLFYATWSLIHHFVAIGEFKLKLYWETPNLI